MGDGHARCKPRESVPGSYHRSCGRLGYVQWGLPIHCLPAPGTQVTGTGIYVHGGQVTISTQKVAEKQSDLLVNRGTLLGAYRHISAKHAKQAFTTIVVLGIGFGSLGCYKLQSMENTSFAG